MKQLMKQLMKKLRKVYFKIFKVYKRIDFKCVSYAEADMLFRTNEGKPKEAHWILAKEEDSNIFPGIMVCMERRVRITE